RAAAVALPPLARGGSGDARRTSALAVVPRAVRIAATMTPKNTTTKPKASVKVRRWTAQDIPAIVECQRLAYPDYADGGMYDRRMYELQFAAFPEGQFLAEVGGQVIGYATSLIVQLDAAPYTYEYDELTGAGTFSTHTPGGDTLYGADIAVVP